MQNSAEAKPISPTDLMVLRFREVLAATELLAPQQLRDHQEGLLRPLLRHARAHVPFYGARLAPVFHFGEVDLSRWSDIPILTRADAQNHAAALTARALPPNVGPSFAGATSGSTGRPVRYSKSQLASVAELALTDRLYRWWGMDGNKTLVFLAADQDLAIASDPQLQSWAWRTGCPGGAGLRVSVAEDAHRLLDRLLQVRPNYVLARPPILKDLSQLARERGADLVFDLLLSTGGVLDEDVRGACREVFSARIADAYGADEVGQIACGCPHCGLSHVNAEAMLVELLRDDGEPVAPGEPGRVIITNFYNYAMPLIRYEIGDYAIAPSEPVKCPIRLPALSRIFGRYRGTLKLADGRILFPQVDPQILTYRLSCRQFQIVQTSYHVLELRYVSQPGHNAPDTAAVTAYLQHQFDNKFQIIFCPMDRIERSANGKFEDIVSLVPRVTPSKT